MYVSGVTEKGDWEVGKWKLYRNNYTPSPNTGSNQARKDSALSLQSNVRIEHRPFVDWETQLSLKGLAGEKTYLF